MVVEEVWTPPLSDATSLIQKVRSARPDLLLFMPNAISDAKLGLEKINEFGLGRGKIPTVSFSITIAEPDMLQSVSPDVVQGITDHRRQLGFEGPRGSDRRAEGKIQGAMDDAERHLDLWRHVADEGGAGKSRQEPIALPSRKHSARWMAVLRNITRAVSSNSTKRAAASAPGW